MLDVDTFLTALYVIVDELRQFHQTERSRPGPDASLSVVARSSPSLSSAGGLDSPAKGTSIATPRHIFEEHSPPCPTVPSSTGSRDSMPRTSRRSP